MMKKICCYTCITGAYDSLKMISGQKPETMQQVDFICFSDSSVNQLDWKILPIPDDLQGLSQTKQQRVVKICPHRYLKEYDVSVWIDGSFKIIGDVLGFINQYDLDKSPLYTRVHPQRRCIYEEAEACIALRKDSREVIDAQLKQYQADGYPKNAGMAETGIILRKHNDMRCQLLGNLWASELLRGSCRDQLSFNYSCWKMHFLPGCLKNEFKAHQNQTFKLLCHGNK